MTRHRLGSRIAQSLDLYKLTLAEKTLLEHFAAYDGELDAAESGIKLAGRRNARAMVSAFGVIVIGILTSYLGFFAVSDKYIFIIIGTSLNFITMFWVFSNSYRWAADPSFLTLREALSKVDPALQTVFASAERAALARKLMQCKYQVRRFGSRPVFRLHNEIIRQQAIRASSVFQDLTYLAILGDDKELEKIRSALAKAILKIGTSDWVKVGDITVNTDNYAKVKTPRHIFNSGQLITVIIVMLTAIPALPVLISALK